MPVSVSTPADPAAGEDGWPQSRSVPARTGVAVPQLTAFHGRVTASQYTVPMNTPTLLRNGVIVASLLLGACASRGGPEASSPGSATVIGEPSAAASSNPLSAEEQRALAEAQRAPAAPLVATATALTPEQAAAQRAAAARQDAADAGGLPPTQAEQDYAALYGGPPPQEVYDPVADPTLPDPVQFAPSYDPWEKWNRKVHRFNNAVDRGIAKPLAKAYVKVVPRPARLGVSNFFNNLSQPVSAVNNLLQGHPLKAGVSLGRFAINTVFGIGGVFDVATRMQVPNRSEDFGQTLGVWGWKNSRYVELPLFGPRTVRDTFGLVADAPMAPLRYVEEDKVRVFLQGLQLVDVRTQLMALDSMREGATDEYALFRDGWLQRRNFQIARDSGDKDKNDDSSLPDYLRDDQDNPTVPVDVMPYVPEINVP